jgi:hypothetical protein
MSRAAENRKRAIAAGPEGGQETEYQGAHSAEREGEAKNVGVQCNVLDQRKPCRRERADCLHAYTRETYTKQTADGGKQ